MRGTFEITGKVESICPAQKSIHHIIRMRELRYKLGEIPIGTSKLSQSKFTPSRAVKRIFPALGFGPIHDYLPVCIARILERIELIIRFGDPEQRFIPMKCFCIPS